MIEQLRAFNDPKHHDFFPTVVVSRDPELEGSSLFSRWVLQPYVRAARRIVRRETDVVMLTHLLLYLTTSVPSALWLYRSFTYLHGVLHTAMQLYYAGTYTLMMHQHIHMGGILAKKYARLDALFPYVTDPLHGHTWNSYYFHHVKHHHVEGNGPGDLSSTIRYQRDSPLDFARYLARYYFLIWLDLPLYFLRRGQTAYALKSLLCELSNLLCIALLAAYVHPRATLFVFALPLAVVRLLLMVGNWGQHAFVDADAPESDFRSSATLIDVASNRHCFNDGYHTSHHLNPRRHWREHPAAFLAQKGAYAGEGALVFQNIDYLMVTVRLLRKEYGHLARCLVPMGAQVGMSEGEIAAMLESRTRKFSEGEIREKFKRGKNL